MKSAFEIVAIVGRPNVGKSALFNRLTGRAAAIVEDRPGVTRDRHFGKVEWENRRFWAVDTGGFDPEDDDTIPGAKMAAAIRDGIRRQVRLAIEEASRVIFVVDGKAGLHPLDRAVAQMLREYKKPVILAVNKTDLEADRTHEWDFAELAQDQGVAVSALHGRGVDDLLDAVVKDMPVYAGQAEEEQLRLAIVGRPNVGKSSILNSILNEERNIVSDVPGTTRDAVDTPLRAHGKDMILVDTAGLRDKGKISDEVEKYSAVRSMRAIERCDVALLVIDAYDGVREQDERIAGLIHDAGKACVVVVNKWDKVEKTDGTYEKCLKDIRARLKFMDYALVTFISALSRQRLGEVLPLAIQAAEAHRTRLSTSKLNRALEEILASSPMPSFRGRILKVYYLAQTGIRPPSFALFVNDPKLMHFSTQRRIKRLLRERFELKGTPIILMLRKRS
ncbi:MAG: ribosome biogenesis GTPase Der [candidate division FCPU426 bacterium]